MRTHFDGLLPASVKIVEATPPPWNFELLEQERQYVARAVPTRMQEYAAGRHCARSALALAGHEAHVAIHTDENRAPVFPLGFAGSITHTRNYCAAAVVRVGSVASIGIDAELNRPLPANILQLVAAEEERKMLNALAGFAVSADTLLFSIKEAFYKAYFKLTRHFLDFHGARVILHPEHSRFTVIPLNEAIRFAGHSFRGSFSCANDLLCTAIAIHAAEIS